MKFSPHNSKILQKNVFSEQRLDLEKRLISGISDYVIKCLF
jgi:hypothetical protein